jgi:dihydropteroate synthase
MSMLRNDESPMGASPVWRAGRFLLTLDRPLVMGIVNVTPDSFSDGGQHATEAAACAHCDRLLAEGADLLDIGGESTRPGSAAPGEAYELARVVPVLRHAVTLGVPVSVDTSSPAVMTEALALGVDIVNDVRALRRPGALETVASSPSAGVCPMHLRGEPATMNSLARYDDVVAEVQQELQGAFDRALAAGIAPERVVIDPGYGFAKTPEHNLQLLQGQHRLDVGGRPLLVGLSRKSTVGWITGRPVTERLAGSLAAALAAVARGAAIVRVHDVAATVDALKVWRAAEAGRWPLP